MDILWEIVRRQDGRFDILKNGNLLYGAISDQWLQQQLTPAGFSELDYLNARRQLEVAGKAKVVVPLPEKPLSTLGREYE
jgi:hypothetical protein